jgi:hypothetical protein
MDMHGRAPVAQHILARRCNQHIFGLDVHVGDELLMGEVGCREQVLQQYQHVVPGHW